MRLETLPFDLFTRNIIVAQIIDEFESKYGSLRVLDVGGRNGNLKNFLPKHDVCILDERGPEDDYEKQLLKENKYIVGDILNTGFLDDSFDIVTCLDTIEHLPNDKRLSAIKEMYRIGKLALVIGAPFDSPLVAKAEALVNTQFKRLTGVEHLWLKEHIENRPLPKPGLVEQFVREEGLEFVKIPNNNIFLWLLLQNFNFLAYKFGFDAADINKEYNLGFREIGDSEMPTYRNIYAISKGRSANLKSICAHLCGNQPSNSLEKKLDLIQDIFCIVSRKLLEEERQPTTVLSSIKNTAEVALTSVKNILKKVGSKK